MKFPRKTLLLFLCVLMGNAIGCARSTLKPSERPTSRPFMDGEGTEIGIGRFEPRVEAFITPPAGWNIDKEEINDERTHLVWLSPSRETAYGVVYAKAPFYLPAMKMFHEKALDRVIEAFRDDQGEAELLSQQWDDDRKAMRFEAKGGLYHIRSILTVRGKSVWTVYAGTRNGREPVPDELAIAESAREATLVGREADGE